MDEYTKEPKELPPKVESPEHDSMEDAEDGVVANVAPLKRDLQGRHMQMIAIGGAIGAGLFVSSGEALVEGGPASIVICYIIVGVLMLCTMLSLGELAVMYPINGSYYEYSARFIDPSWGFAMGWTYTVSWMLTLPFEITAASLTIQYWNSALSSGIWITCFLVLVCLIQLFGVRGYGEVEFVLSIIKVITCIGLIILEIIINVGGVPGGEGYIGGKYWHDPGAFANGFKGFCAVFVNAVFAYSGTELVGLAAAETANPRKSLPKAVKQVFFRIALFYIINLLLVGLNVPYTDSRLLGSGEAADAGVDAAASPFVISIVDAKIAVLPSIVNAVVLLSSVSVANSCVYASSRTLQALALTRRAPKFFTYVDSKGRPLWCIITQLVIGLIAYIGLASSGLTVFDWLLAIGSLAATLMYFSINVALVRFRKAMKLQGRSLDEIPWRSPFGIWGGYLGAALAALCIVAVFYSALYPPDSTSDQYSPTAYYFFETYLSAFIALFFLILWMIVKRQTWFGIPLAKIDLDHGRRFAGMDDLPPPEPKSSMPWWKRIVTAIF